MSYHEGTMAYVERTDEEILPALAGRLRELPPNSAIVMGSEAYTAEELATKIESDDPPGIQSRFINLHRSVAQRINKDPIEL